MSSDCAARMESTLGLKVNRVSSFRRFKRAEMPMFTVYDDCGAPLSCAAVLANAKKSTRVSPVDCMAVLGVEEEVGFTQVVPPIVSTNAVSMVNLVDVATGNIQPHQSVSLKTEYVHVARLSIQMACALTGVTSVPVLTIPRHFERCQRPFAPREHTCRRVVVKNFADVLRCQRRLMRSHDACPRRLVRGPKALPTLFGLRYVSSQ